MSTQDLNGKIALVTGASRGTGAAIADTLAVAGTKVIGTATSESGTAAVSERLAQWGSEGYALNSTEPETIENLIVDIEKEFGKLDILINNASVTRDNLLMRMKEEEWDDIMQVNFKSVFHASKVILRGIMKQCTDHIIDITSVVGAMGNAGQTNYAATKAGLVNFSRPTTREVNSRGITANCVAPGFIDTDVTRTLPEETRRTSEAQTSLGKSGGTQDIVDAVLFLASDQAKYITGQTLHVNGGMLMP